MIFGRLRNQCLEDLTSNNKSVMGKYYLNIWKNIWNIENQYLSKIFGCRTDIWTIISNIAWLYLNMYLNCSETIFCLCSNTRPKYRKYLQTLKVSFYFSLFQAVCLLAREERLTSPPSLNGLGFNHQSINQFSSVQQRIHSATSERGFPCRPEDLDCKSIRWKC